MVEICPVCNREIEVETMSTTLLCQCGHEFYSKTNRRAWKRKKVKGVTVSLKGHPLDVKSQILRITDLSLLGFGIEGKIRGLRKGDSIYFELTLPKFGKVTGFGEICWHRGNRGGLKITSMQEVEKRSLYFFLIS